MTGCEVVLGLLTITYVMCDQIILKYLAPIKRFKTVHYKVVLIFQAVDEMNDRIMSFIWKLLSCTLTFLQYCLLC